jgi:hypothetical protein
MAMATEDALRFRMGLTPPSDSLNIQPHTAPAGVADHAWNRQAAANGTKLRRWGLGECRLPERLTANRDSIAIRHRAPDAISVIAAIRVIAAISVIAAIRVIAAVRVIAAD